MCISNFSFKGNYSPEGGHHIKSLKILDVSSFLSLKGDVLNKFFVRHFL